MPSPELVAVVVSSLASFLTSAGDSFAKELGKAASAKVEGLYHAVKDRFAKEKEDKNKEQTFAEFEKKPEEWLGPMKLALMDLMSNDLEFSRHLETLITESREEARKAGTENSFTTMVTGGSVRKIANFGTVEGNVDI